MRPRSISVKLGIAFSVLIVILLGIGWFALSRMAKIRASMDEVIERRWHKVELSRRALRISSRNNRITMQIFLLKDHQEIELLLVERRNNSSEISLLVQQIEGQLECGQEKAAFRAVTETRTPYVDSYERALALLVDRGQDEEARRAMVGVTLPLLLTYHAAWESFVEYQGAQMDQAGERVKADFVAARGLLVSLVSLGVVMATGIAGFATKSLTKEIAIRRRAEDELHRAGEELETRVEARTRDLAKANRELEDTADELAAAQEDLREREERTRSIIDQAFDAIITTDAEDRIMEWNRQAERTFGWTRSEVSGRKLGEVILLPQDREEHSTGIKRFLNNGQGAILHRRMECLALCKDGRQVPIELAITAIRVGEAYLFNIFLRDITERKRSELELQATQNQLVRISHQAGMAEVATGVLHNVGNVLNSVNVSATLIAETLRSSRADNVGRAAALMEEHAADLGTYLTQDAKGRQLPGYLANLNEFLIKQQRQMLAEVASLRKNIEHIKDIVAMQQSYAQVSGTTEIVRVADLVEDALRIHSESLAQHSIRIVREYEDLPPITVDRHKVLQILVNLIGNAKHACVDSTQSDKQLILRVARQGDGVRVEVADNGMGIAPENLARVFSHGFTTRKDGHGFGLHSGALAAKEMDGSLSVQSGGPGTGATFTLLLPLSKRKNNHE